MLVWGDNDDDYTDDPEVVRDTAEAARRRHAQQVIADIKGRAEQAKGDPRLPPLPPYAGPGLALALLASLLVWGLLAWLLVGCAPPTEPCLGTTQVVQGRVLCVAYPSRRDSLGNKL